MGLTQRRSIFQTILLLALTLSGCGETTSAPARDPIPPDLATIETAAEGLFEGALTNDEGKVATGSKQVADMLPAYRAHAAKDGVPSAALQDLEKAATSVAALVQKGTRGVELARASNGISAPMAQLYAAYRPPVPVGTLDLDYLGRELLLDAREKDFARAKADAGRIASIWQSFRGTLLAAGGGDVATRYETALGDAKRAIAASDSAAIETAATAGLDHVDAMEKVFTNQPPAGDPGD